MTAKRGSNRLRPISFEASLKTADGQIILRLPDAASKELPSRGQVAVHGTIDEHPFETVIEPDGEFGHWMRVDSKLQKNIASGPGNTAAITIEPAEEWPEPRVPKDLRKA